VVVPLITRWRRDENGEPVTTEDGKNILEVLTIHTDDVGMLPEV
jgi:hypothetical protein